ncbi:MAG: hypothetical protein N3I35_00625 [Clostridia bacterium]|nr:hypothetical protein [Clostridia bacterium]
MIYKVIFAAVYGSITLFTTAILALLLPVLLSLSGVSFIFYYRK